MKDLNTPRFSLRSASATPRIVAIIILALMLVGLIIMMFLFAGGPSVSAEESVYADGKLKTLITCSGDTPQTVWVQHIIYRDESILVREQVGETYSVKVNLHPGSNLVDYTTPLSPGQYTVFTYISTTDEYPKRIAGTVSSLTIER